MDITGLIARSSDQRAELARVLDEVGHSVRVKAVRELGRRDLAELFEAAADNAPTALTDLVPESVAPLTPIIHYGKNSLPAFSHFEKRFCRPEMGGENEIWGYNEQSMRLFTGPGYFVAAPSSDSAPSMAGVIFDYRRLPPSQPPGWPTMRDNRRGLSRFIYADCEDLLRKVSDHVTIGRVRRRGAFIDAWFALVRQPLAG